MFSILATESASSAGWISMVVWLVILFAFMYFFKMCIRDRCGTESTHDAGNIRTDTFDTRNFLKTAQYGIVVKRTALYDDIFPELACIGKLDYLK